MIKLNLSDLQRKDIVNILDGKRLGRIVDAEIDESGTIIHFVIEPKRFFKLFHIRDDVLITFKQIKKIGEDVILVEFSVNEF